MWSFKSFFFFDEWILFYIVYLNLVVLNGGRLSYLSCFLAFYQIRSLKLQYCLFGMFLFILLSAYEILKCTGYSYERLQFFWTHVNKPIACSFLFSLNTIATLYSIPYGLGAGVRFVRNSAFVFTCALLHLECLSSYALTILKLGLRFPIDRLWVLTNWRS